ncbi:WD40-repeat-containing domain protein [Blyttiomyces helicus]|uniref:WD40-repeat-containing domain protein n=1 Tax=Blyttiomyces helicus TaxID=388810 RepID=A0A4P9WF73_9FUNG|nr:WD40-repeat-containing domain protein [Blyttiomyces helicus]|eukprot:RKO89076.1 WD40-repeat-containing domain protein [Blyttiomyces helicus]
MEAQLCLDLHDSIALTLDVWSDPDPDSSDSMLFFGTDSGHVTVISFSNVLFSTHMRKKDRCEVINIENPRAIKGIGNLWKRRAHGDWVLKVKYYRDLKSIISCSPDPNESLVVATENTKKKWTFYSVPVHKGVNTFAFSKFPVQLVTGGADRQLRLWNPHRLRHPMAALKGHASPIVDICINSLNGQVISLSTDKIIKVWDIRKQQCLQTLFDAVKHRPEDILSHVFFNPATGGKLIAASNTLTAYNLKDRIVTVHDIKSHDMPLRAALYNATFKQVVSGCDGGVINVWDAVSGSKTFRFSDAHGKSEVTAMAFDAGCRRLITGGRDGTIRVWNFNNGQLLQELVKGEDSEVTGITYIDMKERQYMVATGWNRKVSDKQDMHTVALLPSYVGCIPKDNEMRALGAHDPGHARPGVDPDADLHLEVGPPVDGQGPRPLRDFQREFGDFAGVIRDPVRNACSPKLGDGHIEHLKRSIEEVENLPGAELLCQNREAESGGEKLQPVAHTWQMAMDIDHRTYSQKSANTSVADSNFSGSTFVPACTFSTTPGGSIS